MNYSNMDLIKKLAELGFMSAYYGHHESCEKICAGLRACQPDSAIPYMIQAMSEINQGNTLAAIELLEKDANKSSADGPLLLALSALACNLAGLSRRCEDKLNEVFQHPASINHAEAVNLAIALSETITTQSISGVASW